MIRVFLLSHRCPLCVSASSRLRLPFISETPANKYAMLPSLWHGMEPAEKKEVVSVIDSHGTFSVDCVRELHDSCSILMSDMQSIRLCYEVAENNPSHIDVGVPSQEELDTVHASDEISAQKQMNSAATHGLERFWLKPDRKTGMDLFSHMVVFCK